MLESIQGNPYPPGQPLVLSNLPLLALAYLTSKWSFVYPVQELALGPSLQIRGSDYRWKVVNKKQSTQAYYMQDSRLGDGQHVQ